MDYTRITSYQDGKLVAEHLYLGKDQVKAILRFRKSYPEHKECVVIAEPFDVGAHEEHFKACLRCGCVH